MGQLLWIGCLESDEEFERKASKGYDLASAQTSQKNLLFGIEQESKMTADSINGSVLPPFPIYKDKDVEPVIWSHANGSYDVSVGYRNDKYVNRLNCRKSMISEVRKWYKERYAGGELAVFTYSMRSAPMAAACKIKRMIPNVKLYLIVTDLPAFMDMGQSKMKALLKRIDWKSIQRMQLQFDGFVLYTEKMAEYLRIPEKKWVLMEGSYDVSETINIKSIHKEKAIMYSGKLDKQYGINMLLDAFMQIEDPELELWLTGGGNAEEYIRECAQRDKRIKFYGFIPSRKEVLNKQKRASVLINMRLPSEAASDYSFPSKLFEYMGSGTPVLSFRLGGIPKEYYPYLYPVEEETMPCLIRKIKEVLNASCEERNRMGTRAGNYITNEKNINKQCRKILNFCNL